MLKYIPKLLTLLLLTFLISISCNSIKNLEARAYHGKTYYQQIQAARLLHKKEPFNQRGIEVILDYYNEQKFDSANIFFDNLTNKYPKSVEPYLLREIFSIYPESNEFYNELALRYFNLALKIDSLNPKVLNALGKLYYDDFIYPLEVEKPDNFTITGLFTKEDSLMFFPPKDTVKRISQYPDSAQKALYYYDKLWQNHPESHYTAYFPIKQLECYLKINSGNKYLYPPDMEYFPAGHFANLANGWECDFTTNYTHDIEWAQETDSDRMAEQLTALKEQSILTLPLLENQEIYRFTWLRSFHKPISIRIEKTGDVVHLYYKVGSGMGGYKPKSLKSSGKKTLSITEWDNFVKLVEAMDYNSWNNNSQMTMMDGAEWMIEHKTSTKFQAKKTNIPGEDFTRAGLYLVRLANIKIPEEEIY